MNIWLLEGYDTGSHAAWRRGYAAHSAHHIVPLTLPGHFWQWRMLGGAVSLARQAAQAPPPDRILATDMLDLTTFLALTRARTHATPTALYFHENQLTYPPQPRIKPKKELAFINLSSALAADAVYFNSAFHRDSFLEAAPRLLKGFGDLNELASIPAIAEKASVLPVGVDLARLEAHRAAPHAGEPPLILWNHRWEPDKNPRPFLNALQRLHAEGFAFRVALLGENVGQAPPNDFLHARDALGAKVVQFGYAESFAAYAAWLWSADVVVSTAQQDFFGISLVEALYCGCYPLLVKRLNYPALIPPAHHKACLFHEGHVYDALRNYLTQRPATPPELAAHVAQFAWTRQAPRYDAALAALQRQVSWV